MQKVPATPLLVSYSHTAELLGISDKTIRNQISRGSFPLQIVKIGGRCLIRLSDIYALVGTSQVVVTPADPAKRGRGRPRKILKGGC